MNLLDVYFYALVSFIVGFIAGCLTLDAVLQHKYQNWLKILNEYKEKNNG